MVGVGKRPRVPPAPAAQDVLAEGEGAVGASFPEAPSTFQLSLRLLFHPDPGTSGVGSAQRGESAGFPTGPR